MPLLAHSLFTHAVEPEQELLQPSVGPQLLLPLQKIELYLVSSGLERRLLPVR